MSRNRTICCVPGDWTLEDYCEHSCGDGSHYHTALADLKPKIDKGLVVWLIEFQTKRQRRVAYVLPEAHPGPQTVSYSSTEPINSGLSNAVGEELAMAVYRKEPYAAAMLSLIRGRREAPDPHR